MSDSIITPANSQTDPSTTTPGPHIPEKARLLFQRIINMYHWRLHGAWYTWTQRREEIPSDHKQPPCIDNWPLRKIRYVLSNFKNHLRQYPKNTPIEIYLPRMMVEGAEDLAWRISNARPGSNANQFDGMSSIIWQDYENVVDAIDESLYFRLWMEDENWDWDRFA